MVPWIALRARILRVLEDQDRDNPTWDDYDLLDYVNGALVAVSQHTAQEIVLEDTLPEATSTYDLPDDLITLGPVWYTASSSATERLLTPLYLKAGQDFPTSLQAGNTTLRTSYYEFPKGRLNFVRELAANAELKIFYFGYWTPVTDDNSQIKVPRWMEEPLKWHCLASAMAKPAAEASESGQYKSRREAGGPEDNPLLEYARYCQRQYERLMAEHAAQDRSGWESNT